MSSYSAFEVRRADLHDCRFTASAVPEPHAGEALLEVDAFGLTSNNVTYAVLGDTLSYWDFFPGENGWGRIPVWGFAEVAASRHSALAEGTRVFGFLPPATHLVVQPDRVTDASFVDASPHRRGLPPAYNSYVLVEADQSYDPDREPQQMLLRPLFFLSFLLADFLVEIELAGARTAVISSASSKAALGTAFLLARHGVPATGLTSEANLDFTRRLDVYSRVASYREIDTLDVEPAVYVDISGNAEVRAAVHRRYGEDLRHSAAVGQTHWQGEAGGEPPLPGPQPMVFFAPDRIRQRTKDWGRDGLEARMAEAWRPFSHWTDGWLEIARGSGAARVEAGYREVLDGRCPPWIGHVLRLAPT
jgi:hypothetical protein